MRVLIADDDRVFVELTRTRLRKLGFNVQAAFDSPTALMAAIKDPPDAILLDIGMPGGTGLHTLQRLKASARTQDVPVIVITGSDDPEVARASLDGGAAIFLRKPVDSDALRTALAGVLGVDLTRPSPD